MWALKSLTFAVVILAATAYLSKERSRNVFLASLKGVPIVVSIVGFLLVVLTFLLTRTAWGRHVYAVGGNAEAARRAGINVDWVRISCFMMCSSLAAMGGVMLASRTNSVNPNTGGSDTLLFAVAAAVIGGTSLFGGRGRVLDAILGASVITAILNGMTLLNQPQGKVYIITGAVLLLRGVGRRDQPAQGRCLGAGLTRVSEPDHADEDGDQPRGAETRQHQRAADVGAPPRARRPAPG